MPNYAPLPPIELDPRNESELVAAAAQRVYEASGSTINDFSSGSPIMALLEGQAFAQAELLAFANSFPEAVLVEWIGPFLGAQRRTGAGSIAELTIEITPSDQDFVVFAGFEVATDPNLTGGQAISFVTTELLRIPPGESSGKVQAASVLKGTSNNVRAGSITRPVTALAGVLSVNNAEAATGGQDAELLSEVKERFFTLIRRRNPVSAEDWVDFFSDALGPGTAVNVLPRRSEKDTYRYDADFVNSSPSVAFFVLNPDGTPLTSSQRFSLQNLLKFALPTEFTGTVYSMEVDDADVVVTLKYDQNKPYAANTERFTETVRNNLFGILTPNAVFPTSYEPNVSDLEGALTTSFPLTLGVDSRYIDPDVEGLTVYHTPKTISRAEFTASIPQGFKTGSALKAGDLVINFSGSLPVYFSVSKDFSPTTGSKTYHANAGDLNFRIIKALENGSYSRGDVISYPSNQDAAIYVVKTDFTYNGRRTVEDLIASNLITEGRDFTEFVAGAELTATDEAGQYNPMVISFERADLGYEVYEPRTPVSVPLSRRPGYPIWVAAKNFNAGLNLTDLGTAQVGGFVSTSRVQVELFTTNASYTAGEFLVTPDPEQILTGQVSEDACYFDRLSGFTRVHLRVVSDFFFSVSDAQTYSDAVNSAISAGLVEVVQAAEYIDCAGRPLFANNDFRYRARFSLGEYLRFRPVGGFDSSALEDCLQQASACDTVTTTCKRLLEANLPLPRYFQAMSDFTPTTSDIEKLIEDGLILEVDPSVFRHDYTLFLNETSLNVTADLTSALISAGKISDVSELIPGQTLRLVGPAGDDYGSYYWNSLEWSIETGGIPTYREMFRFAPNDAATFRNGASVRVYEATEHVTPIMNLETYYDNGIFVRSDRSGNVSYYDPNYHYEDIVIDETASSQRFYRVCRSFTPSDTVNTWAGSRQNTPRISEVQGNLLKFVVKSSGADRITSRLGSSVSASKLGSVNINVISKSNDLISRRYVWESTETSSERAELSYSPTQTNFGFVDYGEGTIGL